MIEHDYFFGCPYCGEELSARLDASGGSKQKFIQDCEVCCRPIQIEVQFGDEGEVEFFTAQGEDE